jgi:peptidyl-prolyl cis-trans isomerase-like 2
MGKNQHSKDRMFLTATEWKEIGGKRTEARGSYRPLPFNACALSLQPFEVSICPCIVYIHSFRRQLV